MKTVPLAKAKVEIGEFTFEVGEIPIGEMLDILPRLQGDDEKDSQQAQFDMMKLCIYVDGEQIGDGVTDLGLATYLTLANAVMAVNGLGSLEAGDKGKD